jgi:hypothetical protein
MIYRKIFDLTGEQFGRWTVIKCVGRRHGGALYLCRCECGNEKEVPSGTLRAGQSQSCGCWKRERGIVANTKHGRSSRGPRSAEYRSWCAMKRRCDNPSTNGYENYGGRGIVYCERWASFENFLADMGERPPGHSLDRIDVNGNYTPENCRWATAKEQQWGRRDRTEQRARKLSTAMSSTRK